MRRWHYCFFGVLILFIVILILYISGLCYFNNSGTDLYTGKRHYRLSDVTMFSNISKRELRWTRAYHVIFFPFSIASRYILMTKNQGDVDLLYRIAIKNTPMSRSPYSLIHLRVGDVIENASCTNDNFYDETCLNGGRVHPISYFLDRISQLPKEMPVYIIAGSHKKLKNFDKSWKYIRGVEKELKNEGYNVRLRTGKDPDADLIFAAHSSYYIGSTVGYGKLLSDMVKKNNGKVIA